MPDLMPPTCGTLLMRAVQELLPPCLKGPLEVVNLVPALQESVRGLGVMGNLLVEAVSQSEQVAVDERADCTGRFGCLVR